MNVLNNIKQPTLLLDRRKCINNIEKMVKKAADHGLCFRPHFKTHQSVEIGRWFNDLGVRSITVSSLSMAEYFARAGWQDITVAFPVNVREMDAINRLAGRIQLNLLVESSQVTDFLAAKLKSKVNLFIKIDSGLHRTGLEPAATDEVDRILDVAQKSPRLNFSGFLTHSGHTYRAKSVAEIKDIHTDAVRQLSVLKEKYRARFPHLIVSIGDTPSCSLVDDFSSVDEIRPGNFVFFDVMQWQLGSCAPDQVAVALACPVVAKHEQRGELVLYGGAIHLSKERLVLQDGRTCYGVMVELKEDGWEIPSKIQPLTGLSQEHGILNVDKETMQKIAVGDLVGILPVHSCLTAHLMKGYLTFDGQTIDHLNGRTNFLQT
ncbi:alanine racemase [Caldithrix abyssi]